MNPSGQSIPAPRGVDPVAATILAGHDDAKDNIYFVSQPDAAANMSMISPAQIAPTANPNFANSAFASQDLTNQILTNPAMMNQNPANPAFPPAPNPVQVFPNSAAPTAENSNFANPAATNPNATNPYFANQTNPNPANQNFANSENQNPAMATANPANSNPDFPATANQNPINQAFAPANNASGGVPAAAQYLDEIAAHNVAKPRFLSGKMLVVVVSAVVVLVAVLIVSAAMNNVRQAPQQSALAVGNELNNLETLVNYGRDNNISTPKTAKILAETGVVALSRQNDLADLFTLTSDKSPSSSDPTAGLDSAKASGSLESAYATALKNQLNTTYVALQNLDKQTSSADGQAAIAKALSDLEELYRRITE